jgi:hypothetical protein
MSIIDGMRWFKNSFRNPINTALQGTPFSLDLLTAIAVQETFEVWGSIHARLGVDDVLKLCVGDTLDAPNRSAFPKNKAALVGVPKGNEMFAIAREALESLAAYNQAYKHVAQNPDKFCHGFGIFQYDIQFFPDNPVFFLQKRWYVFDDCLAHCMGELKAAMARAGLAGKTVLTDTEMVYAAIAYNCGSFNPSRGLRQGYYSKDEDKYYGEYVYDYLQRAKTVP